MSRGGRWSFSVLRQDTDIVFRWTLWRNQPDRARAILSDHMSTPQAAPELQQAFVALSHHNIQIKASRTLFSKSNVTPSSPRLHPWRRLFLACLVQTMRALSGIVTTQLYLTRAASYLTGFDSSFTLNDAIPTFVFVFSLIPYILIDRPASGIISPFGRRGLLMLSAIGLFAMFLIATIVSATTGSFSLLLVVRWRQLRWHSDRILRTVPVRRLVLHGGFPRRGRSVYCRDCGGQYQD